MANSPELSFWLDDYNDIYSDFDSRHYLKRRISDDFLHELRVSLKDEAVKNIALMIPADKRNTESERFIITSLHNYFNQQFSKNEVRFRNHLRKGLIMLLIGIVIMLLNFILNFKYRESVFLSMLRVLFEPGSWFLIWAGLDTLYYDIQRLRKEKNLYRSLSQMKIHFRISD